MRDEKGNVFILILILLIVGGLILTPLLGLMSTGLVSGMVYERKTSELYAADAGVEDAIWRITHNQTGSSRCYPAEGDDPWFINGKIVRVCIDRGEDLDPTCHTEYRYQILSNATSSDGSTTTVHAVLKSTSLNYSDLTGNAITSGGDVTILPSGTNTSEIQGDISLPPGSVMNPAFWEEDGYPGGEVKRETLVWPELDDLREFYLQDVEDGTHYYADTEIDLEGEDLELGPLYVEGKLDIVNSSNTPATLTLTSTIYSTGDTFINGSGDKGTLYLNLSGETIFVTSNSTDPKNALWIKDKCTIQGPGSIIVAGDIYFEPNIEAGMTEPVLIYSVQGTTHMQPGGDFYGSILGYAEVELQPHCTIIYPEGGFGELNFPGLIQGKEGYSIESWQIKYPS